jgi:hypothetical protein
MISENDVSPVDQSIVRQGPSARRRNDRSAWWPMAAMRLLFLCGLLLFVFRRDWNDLLFHLIIFTGSLFIPLLGRRNPRFYLLDFWVMFIFTTGLAMTVFGTWPQPQGLNELVFGTDKLFHIAAGACLAMFAALLLRPHVTNAVIFYGLLVVFAIAIGAVWEVFEWSVSELPSLWLLRSAGYTDSMLDIIADTIGAGIVVLVLKTRRYY